NFARVYDLQTSTRSTSYYRLFPHRRKPEWCGIVKGATHQHKSPLRTKIHTIERHIDQLGVAGITNIPAPDFSWAMTDISKYALPARYALLVPGGSAHRPEKRWPAIRFAELAEYLTAQGITRSEERRVGKGGRERGGGERGKASRGGTASTAM